MDHNNIYQKNIDNIYLFEIIDILQKNPFIDIKEIATLLLGFGYGYNPTTNDRILLIKNTISVILKLIENNDTIKSLYYFDKYKINEIYQIKSSKISEPLSDYDENLVVSLLKDNYPGFGLYIDEILQKIGYDQTHKTKILTIVENSNQIISLYYVCKNKCKCEQSYQQNQSYNHFYFKQQQLSPNYIYSQQDQPDQIYQIFDKSSEQQQQQQQDKSSEQPDQIYQIFDKSSEQQHQQDKSSDQPDQRLKPSQIPDYFSVITHDSVESVLRRHNYGLDVREITLMVMGKDPRRDKAPSDELQRTKMVCVNNKNISFGNFC